jgi:hypothetical protein
MMISIAIIAAVIVVCIAIGFSSIPIAYLIGWAFERGRGVSKKKYTKELLNECEGRSDGKR